MSDAAYPEVADLIPHSGRMLLLDAVVAHDATATTCSAEVDRAGLFREADGSIPAWLSLEVMAQCAAVHGALAARDRGEALQPGFLVGARRLRLHTDALRSGGTLTVTARFHGRSRQLLAFDCEVCDLDGGAPLADGRLSVYTVDSWDELLGDDDER